jgi:very-short-patch-repair endonuclease
MSNIKNILAQTAKDLRRDSTETEQVLWKYLRAKRLDGSKFRRQELIGKFIVDFVCYENKLIIELDGGQHREQKERDSERDAWLESQGFKVLRFWNNEVMRDIEAVMKVIRQNLNSPSTQPLP